MRNILFRGRRKDYKKFTKEQQWIYGDLIHEPFGTFIQCIEENQRLKISVDDNTVGQFTGVINKNDRLIFEGDLVKYHEYELPFTVVFKSCYF